MRILLCPKYLNHIDLDERMLIKFVDKGKILYEESFPVYNVHQLVHICDDVKKFGVLDNFSAFKFENYNKTLKKFLFN